jgi:hypothetical protein
VTLAAVAELAVWVLDSVLVSLWIGGTVAEGSPGSGTLPHLGPLGFLLRFGPALLVALLAPIVAGVGGIVLFWSRHLLVGRIAVCGATGCAVIAAVILQLAGYGIFSTDQFLRAGSLETVLPFCVALSAAAIFVRRHKARSLSAAA